MYDCLETPHRFCILKHDIAQRFAINAAIGREYLGTERLRNLHRYRLTAQIKAMHHRIGVDIALSAHCEQHFPYSSFTEGDISRNSKNARHERISPLIACSTISTIFASQYTTSYSPGLTALSHSAPSR